MASGVDVILKLTYFLDAKGLRVPLTRFSLPTQFAQSAMWGNQTPHVAGTTRNNFHAQTKFPCVQKEVEINKRLAILLCIHIFTTWYNLLHFYRLKNNLKFPCMNKVKWKYEYIKNHVI